ncbi:MAG: PQQ-dependent sugar dehydrogenase [Nitrososphaeraceae archaeon]
MAKPQFRSLIALVLLVTISIGTIHPFSPAIAQPTVVKDPTLKVQLLAQGLRSPTSMAFLGPSDILVLEKDSGTVQRIVNGTMLPQPVLQVPVSTTSERGMLGIAIAKHNNGPTYVFLYYTKLGGGTQSLANVLYRYELVNNQQLANPKLLLNLPAIPGANHNGGKVVIGPDNNVYAVIGDLKAHRTQAQNVANGPPADSTGGILRVTQDGQPVPNSPLGQDTAAPLNLYYAYGIRNSFGIDFDPVSGKLWDTENGPKYGDEVNLVEPGFNSGWVQVMGIWTPEGAIGKETAGPVNSTPSSNLVDFGGKGTYRAPEFIWFKPVAPTALKFFDSVKLGKLYQNDMFVGDIKNGNLYHFKLNQDRTGLVINDTTLSNKISNTPQDSQPLIFASGFDGGIADLQVGPEDGYLYVLTFAGSIYRIIPSS